VKSKTSGFTLVELLTVCAIITLLMGILLPSLSFVRTSSKNAAQRAQLNTIEMALLAFKNDQGYYPPSSTTTAVTLEYCGAQKLAEALLGWDLMGFHPRTVWRADGKDLGRGDTTYDPLKTRDAPPDGTPDTLLERVGPYLELAGTNFFRLGESAAGARDGLYDAPAPASLAVNTYVICDVFATKRLFVTDPVSGLSTKPVKAGTPILYFKANTNSKTISDPVFGNCIYNVEDNQTLIAMLPTILSDGTANLKYHKLGAAAPFDEFYDYITDPRVQTPAGAWPYKADSYILISAGADGIYGSQDDICNFKK